MQNVRCHRLLLVLAALQIAGGSLLVRGQKRSPFDQARQRMVDSSVIGAGVEDKRVIQAILNTPRHEFVRASLRPKAYFDMSLPIGDGQTISSPFIVAYMTESLQLKPTDKVLEIGTGSGYQAAVLSPLVKQVYSIEIIESLGRRAQRTLKRLRYENIHVRIGDGYQGWPAQAPFDKMIVTCSPERVPRPLVRQLREGGLLVVPVGERYQQTLYLMRKKDGQLQAEALRPTLFVPMTGTAEKGREVQPDPLAPQVINGGFEQEPAEDQFIAGWYYQRQCSWETDALAPQGDHYIAFRNQDSGRDAHALQGFPIDGRRIRSLRLSAQVRFENVRAGTRRADLPMVAVSFYDQQRRDLGYVYLGPFQGSQPWHPVEKEVQVPPQAREGILRIGLFGATGSISLDSVRISVKKP